MGKTIDKKIQADKWYTMQDMVTNKFIPWATSFWSMRKIVTSDRKKKNVLQAIVTGKGRGLKYHFKGENITKFINEVEAGNVRLK